MQGRGNLPLRLELAWGRDHDLDLDLSTHLSRPPHPTHHTTTTTALPSFLQLLNDLPNLEDTQERRSPYSAHTHPHIAASACEHVHRSCVSKTVRASLLAALPGAATRSRLDDALGPASIAPPRPHPRLSTPAHACAESQRHQTSCPRRSLELSWSSSVGAALKPIRPEAI